jgi:hypothetical protein
MKSGEIVYFKTAKRDSKRKTPLAQFKGLGFGVFLGHLPPFAKEPQVDHLHRMMGAIGFLRFDDVAEFLGDEFGETCVKKFEDKYYGKEIPAPAPVEEPPAILDPTGQPATGGLVDVSGAPLSEAP